MVPVSSRNLQVRLLILVFLAFIPALGIFWYANREFRSLQLEAKEQDLVLRAREVTTTYRHLIYQGETLLATLAEFPQIESGKFPGCTEQLARVLQHTQSFTTISVIGMDGYMACGSLTSEDALYLGDRAYFVRATSRNLFSVGEFALGRITGKPVVGMAYPLLDGERTGAVLGASVDLNVLADTRGGGEPLPEGYSFSVLDPNRRVMVRLPRTGNFTLADSVGSIAEANFPGPPEESGTTLVTGIDLDGIERLFAVAPLRSPTGATQGYLAVGRTRMTLLQEVDDIVNLQLRFLAVGGVVLLVLAWVLGHFWLTRRPPEPEQG
ncbi:MAG: hypothetical protein MUO50_09970 [Longimicrobiales bacterium]|nr:hypothetical protein [Longimicrobiales bacterium]